MKMVNGYMKLVRRILPSPLSIAIILTLVTALLAYIFTEPTSNEHSVLRILDYWHGGFWTFLEFTMQMMLMLVLGHTIALSSVANKLIRVITGLCKSNVHAAVFVTLFSLCAGYFNWGLGLIFGAILARKVGEHAREKGIELNYPLIAACGYTSLMVWHGGLSGSAPMTVNTPNHSLVDAMGVLPITETVLSTSNLVAIAATLIVLPLFAWVLAKRSFKKSYPKSVTTKPIKPSDVEGAERLDHSKIFGFLFGAVFIFYWVYMFWRGGFTLNFLNLNTINFMLFGLAITFHGSLFKFVKASELAIRGSTGILIQFPLYAGIMGIMSFSGLLNVFADFFMEISTTQTFPFFAYLSSAIVNVMVPSGGGQWQVQGPILIEAAKNLNVPFGKTVMALAYGDQLTNMLQPFWALPLLGITGLKAKDILPYSILFMLVGGTIFLSILYLF
ncbi:MAG: short-chain fatty acids transporter [Bacteroidia bacterium]|jgi:short-chain fatty acids transporter